MTESLKVGVDAPKLTDFICYEDYKDVVTLWEGTTDHPKAKRGALLALALSNTSETFGDNIQKSLFQECRPQTLMNDLNGVEKVITFLDKLIGATKRASEIESFAAIWEFRRNPSQNITEYIKEFELKINKCKNNKVTFTDNCTAFMLLLGAKLDNTQYQLIKAVVDLVEVEGNVYNKVKQKLIEMLSASLGEIVKDPGKPQLDEAFFATHEEAFLTYSRNKSKGYNNGYSSRGRGKISRGGFSHPAPKYNNAAPKDQNPIDNFTGKPMKCRVCESTKHLQIDCQHFNKSKVRRGQVYYIEDASSDDDIPYNREEHHGEIPNSQGQEGQNVICFATTGQVICISSKSELNKFTAEALNCAAMDSCCSATIAGQKWLAIYLKALPKDLKALVAGPKPSNKSFMFGNEGTLASSEAYNIPLVIGDTLYNIDIDVVESDIPLLLSKGDMGEIGITLDMKNDTATVDGKSIHMITTSAGHPVIPLLSNKEKDDKVVRQTVFAVDLNKANDTETRKVLDKLHKQFGHRPKSVFVDLLKSNNQWQNKFGKIIDSIIDGCDGCILRKRNPDRPAVTIPMANDFNQILTMDLKIWKGKNILYMIDMFSRYTQAVVIDRKTPDCVINALFNKWIPTFGVPNQILTDNGGEFSNEEMREVCSRLNVYKHTTGAESPWQNGMCEKNHFAKVTLLLWYVCKH